MNARKAKQIRRTAMCKAEDWYRSLLPEDQQKELTREQALQYTPKVSYWNEYHEKLGGTSVQVHVSRNTQRWFYLQEKKKYA